MQPTLIGHLFKACKQIYFLETPTREIRLKTPLICDYCKGSHEADECELNNPPEQKEKREDVLEWTVRSKYEDELANFMLEKKFHTKGIGDMLVQHRKGLREQYSQILLAINQSKTCEPKAPTLAITTRLGISIRSTTQEPVPWSSILYQPSKTSNPPFPSRQKKQKKDGEDKLLLSIFKQIDINLPFFEAMIHMPKGAKVLKDLLSHMEKLEKATSSVKLNEECSAIIQRIMPQKEGDPVSFTLPFLIGPLAVKNALTDLGAIHRSLSPKKIKRKPHLPDLTGPSHTDECPSDYAMPHPYFKEFDIEIRDKRGAENLVADHLSRLENPDQGRLTRAKIRDLFPEERLMAVSDKNNEPWYADYANYLASRILLFQSTRQEKQKIFSDLRHYFWDEPFLFKQCADRIIRRCVVRDEAAQILRHYHSEPSERHHGITTTARKVFEAGSYWPHVFRDAQKLVQVCDAYFMGPFPLSNGNKYILVAIDYVSKWVEAQAFPTSDARNVVNFLKRLFARFGIPKALISDRGTHLCNYQMEKAMKRYRVVHQFSTAYRPQTNSQVSKDMKNRAIELYDDEGSEFIVNKQRVKPYQNDILDTNKDDDVTLKDEGEVIFDEKKLGSS
ncbi:reverse transcriptase domain-containing protein [Tanacetum coccineum]